MRCLRGGVMVMPPKPRPAIIGLSPRIQAFRSIPAQNVPPAPVSTPTRRPSSASSSSAAAARARAAAPSRAFLASGRLIVMTWTWPRRSTTTGSAMVSSCCPVRLLLSPATAGSGCHANHDFAGWEPVRDPLQRDGDVGEIVHFRDGGPQTGGHQVGQSLPGLRGLLRQPLGPGPQLETADGDVLEQDDLERVAGGLSPGLPHRHPPPP